MGSQVYLVTFEIGVCQLFNDTLQSVIPTMFPVLELELGLTLIYLGLISFDGEL